MLWKSYIFFPNFNPRPPCGGRPRRPPRRGRSSGDFNPRPPCGGRLWTCSSTRTRPYFNPRPPCGGRLASPLSIFWICHFNPRPPCGGRRRCTDMLKKVQIFQSTSSVWRTTRYGNRVGRSRRNFNPRPPCGGRRRAKSQARVSGPFQSTSSVWRTTTPPPPGPAWVPFQSTSSVWRTTVRRPAPRCRAAISIHVLRAEDDPCRDHPNG